MSAPVEPEIDELASVAFPLNDTGPLISRAPDVPAERMSVEM